jgi:hypothetical protein
VIALVLGSKLSSWLSEPDVRPSDATAPRV